MIPALGRSVEQSPAAPSEGRMRLLIVDEALPVRRSLLEVLSKMGFGADDVLQATSAPEALSLFREHAPHIVFAEFVGVHAEDGLEVLHEMLEQSPTVRIVLLTAEPRDAPEVRAAIRAGVFAYVEKPLRHEKIRAVLQDLDAEEGGIERMR